jgi:anti-sigma factor RsiW
VRIARLLNRTMHLSERELVAAWIGGASPAHLRTCAACGARLEELAARFETVRAEAEAEADAAFPPERLAAQRESILKRIEQVDRGVRLIAFPSSGRPPAPAARRLPAGLATAAAAAGLVVGLLAGQIVRLPLDPLWSDRAASHPAETIDRSAHNGGSVDALLLEIEFALETPNVAELHAMDALTPRIRDLAENYR